MKTCSLSVGKLCSLGRKQMLKGKMSKRTAVCIVYKGKDEITQNDPEVWAEAMRIYKKLRKKR